MKFKAQVWVSIHTSELFVLEPYNPFLNTGEGHELLLNSGREKFYEMFFMAAGLEFLGYL